MWSSLGVLYAIVYLIFSNTKLSVADGFLTCYNEYMNITCLLSERIVIHKSLFGYFGHHVTGRNSVRNCDGNEGLDCWIDVTPSVTSKCSGHRSCQTQILYSIDLSHSKLSHECKSLTTKRPSLFVEYNCVSKTLFSKLETPNHVDPEQVGGYLTSVDYTDAVNGGTEWRSHLAEAVCRSGEEHLPFRFNLSAPVIHGSSVYGREEAVSFILTIKDFGMTRASPAPGEGDTSQHQLRLAEDFNCPGPGAPCQRDYLEVQAKLVTDGLSNHDANDLLLPVARFCLLPLNSGDVLKESGADWVGRQFGPLPASTELQFTSNLNLLDPYATPGKGILIEYIALFCTPINPPSGFGVVDYRFQSIARSSNTVAYAEIFCPSDRWLEPIQPKGAEKSGTSKWWLTRQRNTTLVCDHHSRMWSPDRIPEACLTEAELEAFVAKLRLEMEHPVTMNSTTISTKSAAVVPSTTPNITTGTDFVKSAEQLDVVTASIAKERMHNREDNHNVLISIVIGAIFALVIFLLAILLVVYCLRYRMVTKYQKTVSYSGIPERMARSETSFNRSIPSIYPSTVYSVDWRKKWGSKSRWDLFKPWRQHHWSQNLSGTYPDLPRQTLLVGSSTGMSRTPETVVLDRHPQQWRTQMNRSGISSFSLAPGYQNQSAGMDLSTSASPSPWHRTNSTTRLGMRPSFFASSSELISPDLSSPVPRSWWQPWRRSVRKQRRLSTQLQRRREAQYLSQRRLLGSAAGMSNSSSFQLGLSPSTTLGLSDSTQLKMYANGGGSHHQTPFNVRQRLPERPLSQNTSHGSRTLVTEIQDFNTSPGTKFPSAINGYPKNVDNPYSNVDFSFGFPNQECGYTTSEDHQVLSELNETLPSKMTPSGNGLTGGIRRITSFLRTLNESLTPPRSARHSIVRQQQQQPRALSTTIHKYDFLSSPLGSAAAFPELKHPRCKSESGSVRCQRRGFLRSLFNLSAGSKDDRNPSIYNLIEDDASIVEPDSVATRISEVESAPVRSEAFPGANYWAQYTTQFQSDYRRDSDVCTLLGAQSSNTCVANPSGAPPVDQNDVYESNCPYLIPSSVKRQRRERRELRNGRAKVQARNSGSDHLPSGTSSAISSLIFADSVDEDQDTTQLVEAPTRMSQQASPAADEAPGNISALDYFTYDQVHTLSSCALPRGSERSSRPGSPRGQELFSSQVTGFPGSISGAPWLVKRRVSGREAKRDSRPLSDAMISNHYYDGNEFGQVTYTGEFLEPSMPAPRVPPRSPTSPMSHPPLPPLWPVAKNRPQGILPVHVETQQNVYESSDSLYETVDNFKPLVQQTNSNALSNPLDPIDQAGAAQRQKIALPPTPDSAESLKAPVAQIEEDLDDGPASLEEACS